ncbi:MAG: hypothetical protein ACLQIB_12115 [Isosphaeraceae bacterium]
MTQPTISEERATRERAIAGIASRENRALIESGIEAYKRDLPLLLETGKQHQKVAYQGSVQVAIASTYRQLQRQLEKKGYSDECELFITSISPLEGVERDGRGR